MISKYLRSVTEGLQSLEASACRGMQCFVMLSCRAQRAISQCFVWFFYYRRLELYDLITHGFERAPPTHNVAVRPIIIFALTFKARNSVNRVPGTDFLVQSSILSYQKQGLSLELLVSEQPQTHNPMQLVPWSTAQFERAVDYTWHLHCQ